MWFFSLISILGLWKLQLSCLLGVHYIWLHYYAVVRQWNLNFTAFTNNSWRNQTVNKFCSIFEKQLFISIFGTEAQHDSIDRWQTINVNSLTCCKTICVYCLEKQLCCVDNNMAITAAHCAHFLATCQCWNTVCRLVPGLVENIPKTCFFLFVFLYENKLFQQGRLGDHTLCDVIDSPLEDAEAVQVSCADGWLESEFK